MAAVSESAAMEVDEVHAIITSEATDAEPEADSSSIPEDEYEIEAILSHEVGRFKKKEIAYLVSWKGYGPEHNSWVSEEDSSNSSEMIDTYFLTANQDGVYRKSDGLWTGIKSNKRGVKRESPNGASTSTNNTSVAKGRRTGKTIAQEQQIALNARRAKTASQANYTRSGIEITDVAGIEDEEEVTETQLKRFQPDEQIRVKRRMETRRYASMPDWEQVVKYVETVEKDAEKGLIAFVIFENGQRYAYEAAVVNHRCPQKVIAFYESRLRFKAEAANLPPLTTASSLIQQQTAPSDEVEAALAQKESAEVLQEPQQQEEVVEQAIIEEVHEQSKEMAALSVEDTNNNAEDTTLVGVSSDAINSDDKMAEGEQPSSTQ